MKQKRLLIISLGVLLLAWAVPALRLLNPYLVQILMYVGVNMILTLSLNLVNGYMGEFSVGHAGFMAIGAYISSILTVAVLPPGWGPFLFMPVLVVGGLAAAAAGLVVAVPSFKTRGDYLAIVTLAFNMIVKSVLENLDIVGGPRGYLGMSRLTTLFWVAAWVLITLFFLRHLVYSNFGRGILAIREDEVAANLTAVDTRRLKVYAFCISAFFAGVAGGLFAHLLQFINPDSFSILKSTEMLVMVYLGGTGSLAGSLIGAGIFTISIELLRPIEMLAAAGAGYLAAFLPLILGTPLLFIATLFFRRWVLIPIMLVLLMIFRPLGIMGFKEWGWLKPR